MNKMAVKNYNGHFSEVLRVRKNAGIYQRNLISGNKMFPFNVECK